MKYHIITFGCQMNKSDSERIATVLEEGRFQPASKIEEADLIVVNMCSVRQSAVDRVYGKLNQISKINHSPFSMGGAVAKTQPRLAKLGGVKIILTGCILKKDRKKLAKNFDLILDIKDLINWPNLLYHNFYDRRKCSIVGKDYFDIKPKYQSNFSAFVPISNGCNNFCSYCVVPYTRGKEIYRPVEKIICEVKNLVKQGYKKIILLGQNVNSYNMKHKTWNTINFPKLLYLINNIPGDFEIGFLTSHPNDMSDELIKTIASCQKIIKEIHLPVQSGDNKILKKMNRGYTREDYLNLIKKIREKIPDIKLSTDVIVGFPGETKKQFQNTVKLFKEIKFDRAYIAKYSPRPGTAAAKLKDNIPLEEKKRRYKVLKDLLENKKAK